MTGDRVNTGDVGADEMVGVVGADGAVGARGILGIICFCTGVDAECCLVVGDR